MSNRKRSWTDEQLIEAVGSCDSATKVLSALGLAEGGGSHAAIKSHIGRLGLDTSHFRQAGSRPLNFEVWAQRNLIKNHKVKGDILKRKLTEAGLLDYRCYGYGCGISEWLGKPLTLQIDHINGNHFDNRIENLRLLCGNCHSQTETWGRTGRGVAVKAEACACGQQKSWNAMMCKDCWGKSRHTIEWPSLEDLEALIESTGSKVAAGKSLGVSDKAVHKALVRLHRQKNKQMTE